MKCEVWKDIKGYEGLYQVSTYGNIKRLDRYVNGRFGLRLIKERELGKYDSGNGYRKIHLVKEGIGKQFFIHRLVGIAFIPNPEMKPQINHKDFNRQNNHVDNLEWVTGKENTNHAKRAGRTVGTNGKCGSEHHNAVAVYQVSSRGEILNEFETMAEASKRTGAHWSKISMVCSGKRKTAGGYMWRAKG